MTKEVSKASESQLLKDGPMWQNIQSAHVVRWGVLRKSQLIPLAIVIVLAAKALFGYWDVYVPRLREAR